MRTDHDICREKKPREPRESQTVTPGRRNPIPKWIPSSTHQEPFGSTGRRCHGRPAASPGSYRDDRRPTQAQADHYPDPKPCGPGQNDLPGSPDATIDSGHHAVFDAYWDFDRKNLELNLWPPAVDRMMETQTDPMTEEETPVEISTRTSSNVDIQQTVSRIDGSGFEHELTAEPLEEETGTVSHHARP